MYWNSTENRFKARKIKGLIETWDVLKSSLSLMNYYSPKGLIETWDVLKFAIESDYAIKGKGLIETWDVLKFRTLYPCTAASMD